jgi:hypothetical protein
VNIRFRRSLCYCSSAGFAAVALLAGCGGTAHGRTGQQTVAGAGVRLVNSAHPPYITGLAIDPTDGSMLLATNRGLYRIAPGGRSYQALHARVRVGGTVGPFGERVSSLAFVNAGELLGSGHPNGPGLPPFLGVIESRDGGGHWTAIARAGFSDLHVLIVSGDVAYGYDTVLGGIVASHDGGRTFAERLAPPGGLVLDMAIDPHASGHILASTETAIFTSSDGGTNWRRLEKSTATRLAWSTHGLFRADADRGIATSSDGGTRWRRVGTLPRAPGKLAELGDGTLYAALTDGSIVRSDDGGRSWRTLFRP